MKRFELSRKTTGSIAQSLTTLALAATMGLTACGPNKMGPDTNGLSLNNGLLELDLASFESFAQSPGSQSTKDAAETLAKSAELMIVHGQILSAYEVARTANRLDPENKRARLCLGITAPMMEMKGIYARITPFVKEQLPKDYPKFVRKVNEFKNSNEKPAHIDFMTVGPQDIHNERELQDVIARVTLRLDELRLTLKDLNDEDMTITYAAFTNGQCSLGKKVGPQVYSFEPCHDVEYKTYNANGADFMTMQQYVAGFQAMLTFYNAYSLSGLAKNHSRLEYMSPEKAMKTLLANPDFGVLRRDHGFGVLPEIGKDAVMAVRTAMEMREEACSTPNDSISRNFARGFCQSEEASLTKVLSIADSIMNSSRTFVPVEINEQVKMVEVRATKLFKEPIQNVREFLPISIDRCDNLTGLGDNTLGGLLPNADLGWMLERASKDCQ